MRDVVIVFGILIMSWGIPILGMYLDAPSMLLMPIDRWGGIV